MKINISILNKKDTPKKIEIKDCEIKNYNPQKGAKPTTGIYFDFSIQGDKSTYNGKKEDTLELNDKKYSIFMRLAHQDGNDYDLTEEDLKRAKTLFRTGCTLNNLGVTGIKYDDKTGIGVVNIKGEETLYFDFETEYEKNNKTDKTAKTSNTNNSKQVQNDTNTKAAQKTNSQTAEILMKKWSEFNPKTVTLEFCKKVVDIAEEIKCDPEDLMVIMQHESRFNPAAENKINSTLNVGLIQFGADTRHAMKVPGADNSNSSKKDYKKTAKAMKKMSAMEQLDYVKLYYLRWRDMMNVGPDETLTTKKVATLAFRPAYLRDEVVAKKGTKAYDSNSALDTNGDEKITQSELAERLENRKKSANQNL